MLVITQEITGFSNMEQRKMFFLVFGSVGLSSCGCARLRLLFYQHDNLLIPVNGISAVLFLFFQCFLSGLHNMGAMKPQLMESKANRSKCGADSKSTLIFKVNHIFFCFSYY